MSTTLHAADHFEQLAVLARTERGALVAVARAEGLTPEEALESVQDALSTMLSRAPGESGEEAPQLALATLKVMVKNEARNHRRRHHRSKTHLPIEPCCEPGSDHVSVDDVLEQAEDVVRLRACVSELCAVQRAVVTLRLLDERSGEDVAAALGLSRGYVDVLVHRAKQSLRSCMHASR